MSDKHTPGPRHAVSASDAASLGREIAEISDVVYMLVIPVDDALLYAAGPESHACNVELAAIVREMCRALRIPEPADALARSDAAIAKATGDKTKEQS